MTSSSTKKKTRSSDDLLESAKRVLAHEIDGLKALADSLDDLFIETLDLLSAMQGRCVVTGMGKSGHIANKIAATMASTGTPAMFVHPAEASHGDLGMITTDDVVIALSNSGETTELADLLAYTRRFDIPLIAMTSGADSSLAKAADVALVLPALTEACPMGLAPTTSTTVMLALGDAISVAMLERKGFSPDDFQVFHPGGKLGQQLLKVADIMHTGDALPLMSATVAMSDAILVMTAKSFGCLGIVDPDGQLEGIITDGDLRRHMGADLIDKTAGDIMTCGTTTIGPDAMASEALGKMNAKSITTLFVIEDDRPVGIVHIH
ncbi:MAG: KpsF/GutQ family sugar-phosphate isomerase, partial [Rhodospirillaceae bacterium]|nr:KpsF/GutQ family sugar-phosphate isomerase [Rhodospirillaceae bacterium]